MKRADTNEKAMARIRRAITAATDAKLLPRRPSPVVLAVAARVHFRLDGDSASAPCDPLALPLIV